MIRPVLLLTALSLLAGPAVGQDRPRAVRPPANLKEATVQRWIKANLLAGDYVFATYDERGVYFLLPAMNQTPSLNPRRLWMRAEGFATDAHGVRSRRTLYEFDCAEERSRILAVDTFGELNSGEPLQSVDFDLDDEVTWDYVRPDSRGEGMLRRACALEHPRLAKPAGGAP